MALMFECVDRDEESGSLVEGDHCDGLSYRS